MARRSWPQVALLLALGLAAAFCRTFRGPTTSRRRDWLAPVRAVPDSVEDLPVDDLDLEGDLEDDWGVLDDEEDAEKSPRSKPLDSDDELEDLPENLPPHLRKKLKDVKRRLDAFANPESLDSFDSVNLGAGDSTKWAEVPLNDTFSLFACQVPGAANRLQEMMCGSQEITEANRAILEAGDTIWPASVILARWLCIQPPLVPLQGRSVLDLGCGLGIAGVTAGSLGAREVLLQDRDPACLRAALETAARVQVASRVTTLRCEYSDLAAKLMNKEALAAFAQPDVLLGCDVLLSQGNVEDLANVLQILLRNPNQVAYFIDPYTSPLRKSFMQYCDGLGLDVKEDEIVTWEPDWNNFMEYDREWVMRLVTVRRPA